MKVGVVARAPDGFPESFADPARGDATWTTLFSADLTPTAGLSAGIAELAPRGGRLAPHRHAEAEIYHVLSGRGTVTVEGVDTAVEAGASVFIPGDAEHGIRNDGEAALRFFYVFPVDRFGDVAYRFS